MASAASPVASTNAPARTCETLPRQASDDRIPERQRFPCEAALRADVLLARWHPPAAQRLPAVGEAHGPGPCGWGRWRRRSRSAARQTRAAKPSLAKTGGFILRGQPVESADRVDERRRGHAAEEAMPLDEQRPRSHASRRHRRGQARAPAARDEDVTLHAKDRDAVRQGDPRRPGPSMSRRSSSLRQPSRQVSVTFTRPPRSQKKRPVPGGAPRQGR